jgi:hypothetical protein
MLPFSLEKRIPIAGDVSVLVGLGMVVEGTLLVCFRIVRGDDFITSATDVLFSVSDHKILLYLPYVRILNTPSKWVNPSENVFP